MSKVMNTKIQDISDASLEPTGETAASIELFRLAMHSVANRETSRPVAADWLVPAHRRQRRAQHRLLLAWTCAAALCLAVLPRAIHPHDVAHNNGAHPASEAAPSEESYTALLEHVDNEIAEPVPDSLAPLTELDSWNSTSSTISSEKKNAIQ